MKPIKLHNTMSGAVEDFIPLEKGKVGMYQCGPTVYNTAHIGNLRTYVMNDIIRRVFEYSGYDVKQVMNITDVEDKIIQQVQQDGTTLEALTRKYEELFLEDLHELNIEKPQHILRATEHVSEMIAMIATLLEKGVAYSTADGIYFSISKSHNYGKLARISIDTDATQQERIKNDDYDKENPRDFALWKLYVPEDGAIVWEAPFGKGRPGWHIECSAMSTKAFGPQFDLHTGGVDNIFPHHTNEIAQSEAATGKEPFVKYWVHGGFMNVDDTKMSKSKGNFLKLSDLKENMISPLAFRFWLLSAHYRTQVNFTQEAVLGAQNALIKLMHTIMEWPEGGKINTAYAEKFSNVITNDFNMPQAVALMWELVHDQNVAAADKRATIIDFDRVFGLNLASLETPKDTEIPPEISALVEAREDARKNKEFEKSDALRAEIEERGYTVKDTTDGPIVREL